MEVPSGGKPTGRSPDSGSSGETGAKSALDGEAVPTETLSYAAVP